MISNFSYDGPLLSEPKRTVQVSRHKSFIADLKNYSGDSDVSFEIHAVTDLFKEKDYPELRDTYNDHELTDNLKGYSSVNLFYGTQKDVVIVYKKHKNDHIAFHRIGNHEKVYDPDYQQMDKNRQMKKRKNERLA